MSFVKANNAIISFLLTKVNEIMAQPKLFCLYDAEAVADFKVRDPEFYMYVNWGVTNIPQHALNESMEYFQSVTPDKFVKDIKICMANVMFRYLSLLYKQTL